MGAALPGVTHTVVLLGGGKCVWETVVVCLREDILAL